MNVQKTFQVARDSYRTKTDIKILIRTWEMNGNRKEVGL